MQASSKVHTTFTLLFLFFAAACNQESESTPWINYIKQTANINTIPYDTVLVIPAMGCHGCLGTIGDYLKKHGCGGNTLYIAYAPSEREASAYFQRYVQNIDRQCQIATKNAPPQPLIVPMVLVFEKGKPVEQFEFTQKKTHFFE
ncbi:MAG: hypothetical protein KatS3mg033_0889 [Thermonema sp.]|uniref:hypothetical protein n=1 Tax=Thermonema sp. TaxID=2231181 RepID=UPI0021DC8211|nr:hypothetical protein [Thermonema sp.]GIV39089.1 MAG: hypothetical protein KatS3mg033_0889 [Thermonema sp.]